MKAINILFFTSWLLCGCSLEAAFEDPRNMGITILAVIVAIACAIIMGGSYE